MTTNDTPEPKRWAMTNHQRLDALEAQHADTQGELADMLAYMQAWQRASDERAHNAETRLKALEGSLEAHLGAVETDEALGTGMIGAMLSRIQVLETETVARLDTLADISEKQARTLGDILYDPFGQAPTIKSSKADKEAYSQKVFDDVMDAVARILGRRLDKWSERRDQAMATIDARVSNIDRLVDYDTKKVRALGVANARLDNRIDVMHQRVLALENEEQTS